MAATERMMGSLQQSRSAMGSSSFLSFKPFHPSYDFGRSCRKLIPPVQASMAGNKDQHSATLSKSHHEEYSSSRSSSVSSLLRAVQEGGSSVVLQQVSSIRYFFTPELPQVLLREIKKRMALPFKEQYDEENPIQDDLNGGLLKEELAEVALLGPRCAWPRLKLAIAEEERQEEVIQGPRCAWPRVAMQTQSASSFVQQWKQEEGESAIVGEGASGANCAWPRATSRNFKQKNTKSLPSSRSPLLEGSQEVGILKSPQEEGLVTTRSSLEDLQNGAIFNSSQEGLEKEALPKRAQECSKEEAIHVNNSVIEGPRCAWPRATPRRMLDTGVGLSLMNYLLIGQGATAFAILLENPLPLTCEEELSHPLLSFLS